MDVRTTHETAAKIYSTATAILRILDDSAGAQSVLPDELLRILSNPAGKLSVASVTASGADRTARFIADLQMDLFPSIPCEAEIIGAVLVIYYSGDMTTEEYLAISNQLLGDFPEDIQTIVSLSWDETMSDGFKGTLLVSWETDE